MRHLVRATSLTACLLASVQPALAESAAYFRLGIAVPTQAPTAPTAGVNSPTVEGVGSLRVLAPYQVRARTGVPFSLQLETLNPEGIVTWTTLGPSLPAGLVLGNSGLISGTPTGVGSVAAFTAHAVDGAGKAGTTRPFSVDVMPVPSVTIQGGSVQAGAALDLVAQATGLYGSPTWRVSSGTLPIGISLDPATGRITGSPAQKGVFDRIRVSVVDADGATGVSEPFAITVSSNIDVRGLLASYGARLSRPMVVIRPYVTGGSGTYVWSVAAGQLPPGIGLDLGTGALSGKPGSIGRWTGISIQAKDAASGEVVASAPFAIEVADTPTVTVAATYAGRVSAGLSVIPKATGVLGGGSWSLIGAKPAGLQLGTSSGTLGGQLATVGSNAGLRLRVVDLLDGAQATSDPFSVESWTPFSVSPPAIATAVPNVPYTLGPPRVFGLRGRPTYTLSGNLPAGLAFDPATGTVSGTPADVGVSAGLVYAVRDSADGAFGSTDPLSIQVAYPDGPEPFAVGGIATPYAARVGTAFSLAPSVAGNKGAPTWSLSGNAPPWLGIDPATGRVSGTPVAAGDADGLVVTAQDTDGARVSSSPFGIVVEAQLPPSLRVADLSPTAGAAFASPEPSLANFPGTPTYSLASGTLPAGYAVAVATGVISGITDESGTFPGLALSARNASAEAVSPPFAIKVVPASATSLTASIPATLTGVVGTDFSGRPTAAGAVGQATWTSAGAALPSWLSLDPATGALTGRPPAIGVVSDLALSVADASGKRSRTSPFSVSVVAAPQLIASVPATLSAPVNRAFSSAPNVSGARGAQTWTLSGGSLPHGLSLDGATGAIHGTPDVVGDTAGLALAVADETGATAETATFTIAVPASPLSVSLSAARGAAHVGAAYSSPAPTLVNAIGAAAWTTASPLPPGLALDPATGILSGVPAAAGSFPAIVLTGTDANRQSASATGFGLAVYGPPSVSVSRNYGARQGYAFALVPAASNIAGTPSWSLSGTLPAWAGFDPASGTISGTGGDIATTGGLVLAVTDSTGASASSDPFSISVGTGLSMSLSKTRFPARGGLPFPAAVPFVSGNAGAMTFSLSGDALPSWAGFDRTTGAITGTPPATAASTSSHVLAGRDAAGYSAAPVSFTIAATPAPTVSVPDPISVRRSAPIFVSAQTANVVGAPSFALASGSLPAGVRFDGARGELTGSPTGVGTSPGLSVRVTDAETASGLSNTFGIVVGEGITLSGLAPSYAGRAGDSLPVTASPTVSNAIGAIGWSGTQLPGGVSVSSDGRLTGIPSGSGTFPVTVTATDTDGATASGTTSLAISPTLQVTKSPDSVQVHVGSGFTTKGPSIVGQRGTGLSWSSTGNAPPPGAALDGDTGIVSAPTTTSAGAYPGIVLTVEDPVDRKTARTVPFAISVLPDPEIADVPTSYTARLGTRLRTSPPRAVNAIGAVRWTWTEGTSPPGWASVDGTSGAIVGDPAGLGAVPNLSLTATDSTQSSARSVSFTLNILAQPTISLAPAATSVKLRVGDAWSLKGSATGLSAAGTWSLAYKDGSAALPAGLGFDPATQTVSGTANAVGLTSFALKVVDPGDGTVGFSDYVTVEVAPPLAVSGLNPSYQTHTGRFLTTDAPGVTGAKSGVSYALSIPTPPGMTFGNPIPGILKGIPTGAIGPVTVALTATDAWDSRKATTTFDLSIYAELVATLGSMATSYGAHAGVAYTLPGKPQARNSLDPVAWSIVTDAGTAPQGVGLGGDGAVSFASGTAGKSWTFHLAATDPFDNSQATTDQVTVSFVGEMTMAYPGFTSRQNANLAYSNVLPANLQNGVAPVTYTLTGGQPDWTIDASTGQLTGANGAALGSGSYTVTATDGTGTSVSSTASVTVTQAPSISWSGTGTAGRWRVGTRPVMTPTIVNPNGPGTATATVRTSVSGLSLTQAGAFTGAPSTNTAGATNTLVVRVRDGVDGAYTDASQPYVVADALALLNVPNASYTIFETTPFALNASTQNAVGTGSLTWSGLPAGLTVSPTGAIGGAPNLNTNGSYAATATMSDTWDNLPVTRTITFVVQKNPGMTVTTPLVLATQSDASAQACTPLKLTNTGGTALSGLALAMADTKSAITQCTPAAPVCGSTLAVGAACNYGFQMSAVQAGDFTRTGTVTRTGGTAVPFTVQGSSTYAPLLAKNVAPFSYTAPSGTVSAAYLRDGVNNSTAANGYFNFTSPNLNITVNYDTPVIAGCFMEVMSTATPAAGGNTGLTLYSGTTVLKTGAAATPISGGQGTIFQFDKNYTITRANAAPGVGGYSLYISELRFGTLIDGNCAY